MKLRKSNYERAKDFWYKKLKDEGFVDIEYSDGSMRLAVPKMFKLASASYSNSPLDEPKATSEAATAQLKMSIIQDYYCMAHHFLNEYQFDTELERIMWEYHTEGMSPREIAKILKASKIRGVTKSSIHRKLKALEKIMKGLYLSV